jgi:hypothetical protein
MMKKILSITALLFLASLTHAQHIYNIRADSVRIYSNCDTAELILENRTKNVNGFLFNKWNGRTEFRKLGLKAYGNSIMIPGQDTLPLGSLIRSNVDDIYDLKATNNWTLPSSSVTWDQWNSGKVIGYDAYSNPDMPALSDQAFQSIGSKTYYTGLMYKSPGIATGFDLAVNWDGELSGPNGAFLRTKDDTKPSWSAWRELLFKDYADRSYARRTSYSNVTSGAGWYRIAGVGPMTLNSPGGNQRAYARFIVTDMTGGFHQTLEFIVGVHFNQQPFIKILGNSTYSRYPFAAIRVVNSPNGTYDGSAVEILTLRDETLYVKATMVDNDQVDGWTLISWNKTASTIGSNDGLPNGFNCIYFPVGGVVEGAMDATGRFWQFGFGEEGVKTNAGFRTTEPLGMMGDYSEHGLGSKIIWTIGQSFRSVSNFYGIGYRYGSELAYGDGHQITFAAGGNVSHSFGLDGAAWHKGPVTATGNVTAAGFYQSSLRSLKKDIVDFNADALKLIKGVKIVEFTYKSDTAASRHVGIIADDSDEHFSTKAHNQFDTNSSLAVTMKAVQELAEKLEALNKRLDAIEKKIK